MISPAQLRQLAANRFTCSRKADWCEKAATALAEAAATIEKQEAEITSFYRMIGASQEAALISKFGSPELQQMIVQKATTPTTP